jgi:hypothetical protein
MKKYSVLSPIIRNKQRYEIGDTIELEDGKEVIALRAAGAIGDEVEPVAPTAPTDPAERLAAIIAACGQLDPANKDLFIASGAPKTESLAVILGWPVSGKERDAAWAEINKAQV